jgi:hypothetical protein
MTSELSHSIKAITLCISIDVGRIVCKCADSRTDQLVYFASNADSSYIFGEILPVLGGETKA